MSIVAAPEMMTADEFLEKYGDASGVELHDGRVVWLYQESQSDITGDGEMPRFKHGAICFNAAKIIDAHTGPLKLGRIATNDSFVKIRANTFWGADVLFVRSDRLPDGELPEDLSIPPDLVIEVRSPSDRIRDLNNKALEYLKAGVKVAVVLDPPTQSAAVFRETEFPQRFHNGDDFTLPDVLPGFSVPVGKFFE